MTELTRIERLRESAPRTAAGITQVIVDNPGQFALVTAGAIVITRAALRIVHPRTPLEALALFVVLQVGLPHLAMLGVEKGWLTFKVRTSDGQLVPLLPGGVIGDVAPPPPATA